MTTDGKGRSGGRAPRVIPGFRGMPFGQFLRRLREELQTDTATDHAAQLSYYFLFSLFPFLFFLVTLAAYLPIEGAVDSLMERLQSVMPATAMALVRGHLDTLLGEGRPRLLTLGLAAAVWTASRGVDALRKALNMAYGVPESRPFWRTQGLAVLVTLVGTLLLLLSVAAFSLGGELGARLADRAHVGRQFAVLWSWLRWPFTAAVVMWVFALSYYVLPDVRQRFRYITPGSVLGTVVWLGASWGFTVYVEHFGRFNATYGSLGGVVVLLLWLYISGLAFIIGGEVNAILEHASADGKAPGTREEGELPPPVVEPPQPAAARSAEAARRMRVRLWRRRPA